MSTVLQRNNVRESGVPTGQPMIFAHGYGCDQAMWRLVAPAFEHRYRVIVFDHLGFGGSDLGAWAAEDYSTLDAYAADLVDLIRELDLHEVVFVGHSVASMIGVLAAIRTPDRFARLVLLGPSARYLDDPASGYVGGFGSEDIDGLLATLDVNHLGWSAAMAPTIMGNPDRPELAAELEASFCRTDPRVARTFARATFLSDSRDLLDRVTVPTLVLQCSDDAIAPMTAGRFVHQHLVGSAFVVLDATGHCPNLSAPDEVVTAIETYLGPG